MKMIGVPLVTFTTGDPDATASVTISFVVELSPITMFPVVPDMVIVPVVTDVAMSDAPEPPLKKFATAPTAFGTGPLQFVPLVQGTVPVVGSHVDCAAAGRPASTIAIAAAAQTILCTPRMNVVPVAMLMSPPPVIQKLHPLVPVEITWITTRTTPMTIREHARGRHRISV
ncbi:MAG: hypothetical protein ACKON7_00600 [Planctomycetaceae bacterium]